MIRRSYTNVAQDLDIQLKPKMAGRKRPTRMKFGNAGGKSLPAM